MRKLAIVAALTTVASADTPKKAPDPAVAYHSMVKKVANMVDNERAYTLTSAFGLQLLNVLWEDTGRWEGSSMGPNISDVTIEVEGWRKGKQHQTYLMPVMRYENFTDKTADVKTEKILIPVGNQHGSQLELISLDELLKNPSQYLSNADKGKIKGESLWAKRDTHVLVSAQHAFLPVPEDGKATFWPVIFNYQSTKKNPAVLTILVTRQGTSMTIIDNTRDTVTGGDSWGQRLYFNQNGQKAPLIAERLTDVKETGHTANGEDAQNLGEDSNVLMLIQVPLKFKAPMRYAPAKMAADKSESVSMNKPGADAGLSREAQRSDVDVAVLGHGDTEGPYTELDGLTIARDPKFPVRVTLQFYQATSNGVISRDNVKAMAAQIKKVYGKGDYVGSLVVPTGVDRKRPTNWEGVTKVANFSWTFFPGLVERFTLLGVSENRRLGVQ